MTKLVQVDKPEVGVEPVLRGSQDRSRWFCEQLEVGNILFFLKTPFEIPDEDRGFLLNQRQAEAAYHKNIAYRPKQDRLTGFHASSSDAQKRLHAVMRKYSERATEFVSDLLPFYAAHWTQDFASYRPLEEQGRQLRLRARNDLLHVDSFPTRPTYGDRILRIFTNINPTAPRVWVTTETFEGCAARFLAPSGPRELRSALQTSRWRAALTRAGHRLHLPLGDDSPYDRFMLRLHHYLKENREFQESCPKARWEFPPDSTWIVFTDMVAHAVLAGQFALEQTFIVSKNALLLPHKAPANILATSLGHPV